MTKAKYCCFDVESTGIDVFNDRIVQLVISTADEAGNVLETWEWIINPGVEVPDGAADVHGFTTQYLIENGVAPDLALAEAYEVFQAHENLVWVAYNINYDVSILNAEFKRQLGSPYWERSVAPYGTLFDPLVVDRRKDKWRKGNRKLESVAPHYGIAFDPEAAHKADYDVEITARVAARVADKYGIPSNAEQSAWYDEWAEGLENYFRRTDPEAKVNRGWPVQKEEK